MDHFISGKWIFKAAHAIIKMKESALADGINLILVSAFRSIQRQQELVEEKEKKIYLKKKYLVF